MIKNIIQFVRKKKLKKCGERVSILKNCFFQGNIELGNDIVIGRNCKFISTIAKIKIYDNVVFGPEVTIYTGDHQMDILGEHIIEIKTKTRKDLDRDVIIESGCWIGTKAIILKGVTIGKGSVIGAGSIVTKNVPPYSIYTGVPNVRIIDRFSKDEIKMHEEMLIKKGKKINSFFGEEIDDK